MITPEGAFCQTGATLIGETIKFANEQAEITGAVKDFIETRAASYRPHGCGLHVEQAGSLALKCSKVETGECPLISLGLFDKAIAEQLGVPTRHSAEDFDFVQG